MPWYSARSRGLRIFSASRRVERAWCCSLTKIPTLFFNWTVIENRLQSSVNDHQFVKAEYVAVPLDLGRKVCHRNADMIELESR